MPDGRCLCGRVTFAFEGPENWRGHCHCDSCRRATSSPITTFFGVPNSAWRWTGAAPKSYRSSPGVERLFCGRCGSPMAFRSDRWPDETHFYAASLVDSTAFQPDLQYHADEALPWLVLKDPPPKAP